MELFDFIHNSHQHSMYVDHPDWNALYVRKTDLWFGGIHFSPTITLANIQAKHPGTKAFPRLIDEILSKFLCAIFVECVISRRFQYILRKHGYFLKQTIPFSFLHPMSYRYAKIKHPEYINPESPDYPVLVKLCTLIESYSQNP